MKLVFLKADVPLTKSFTLKNKTIETSSYPSVLNFTSHETTASNLIDFNTALRKYAALKYCLLKGEINRPLVDEPRAGSTDSSASTEWVCLDVDGVDVQTPEDFLQLIGITDVSYVVQYSASHGVKDQSLRCHIFMMLTKPMPAALLKQWLKDLNFNTPELNAALQLTKSNMALRWPLDITTCQNDKLLYIAPPIFNGNAKDPFKTGRNGQRILMVKKRIDTLNITNPITSTAENRKREQAKINELRELAGMPERKYTYKMYGATEVLLKPDSSIITEMKQERGFVYFNLNGGDSWAYYHPEDNPDFIFNFKGEPAYLTKELLPDYWNSLVTQASRTSSAGVTYLAFLDKRSGSYYRGTYDTGTDELDIYIAKNETQVRHFAKQVGLPLGDFIPEWEISFDPHDNVRVDVNNRSINTFVPTPFMVATPRSVTAIPPTINKVLHHALGSDPAVTEHFINWLATILQTRGQTRTAWLLHGTQGTGKGVLMNSIIRPIFGFNQTAARRMEEFNEPYNGYMQNAFIVFVDEVQTSALRNEKGVIAKLKNFITEDRIVVRQMYQSGYEVQNYSNWIFASNMPDPISIEAGDRRFNVGGYQAERLQITPVEITRIERELQSFHDYLAAYAIDEQLASTPLETAARQEIIAISEEVMDTVAGNLLAGNMGFFIDALPTNDSYKSNMARLNAVEDYKKVLVDLINRPATKQGHYNISRDELYTIFNYNVGNMPESPNKFTGRLKHHRIQVKKVTIDGKTHNGIQVEWQDVQQFGAYLFHINDQQPTKLKAVK
jgi:hypothetical protein